MSLSRKVWITLLSFLAVVLVLYFVSSLWDMVIQQRISQEITQFVTQKLVNSDLRQETRVKSPIGNYYIPDLSNQKNTNDFSSILWSQILEHVNAFPSTAPPFRVFPVYVPTVETSGSSGPTLMVNVDAHYIGFFRRTHDFQVVKNFSLPHYANKTNQVIGNSLFP